MCGVVDRVVEHLGGERADGPVGLLRGFCEDETEMMVQKRGESELSESDQTGGNSGVEDIFGVGPTGFTEESEIVIAAVDDDDFSFEGFEEW